MKFSTSRSASPKHQWQEPWHWAIGSSTSETGMGVVFEVACVGVKAGTTCPGTVYSQYNTSMITGNTMSNMYCATGGHTPNACHTAS